MIIGKYAYISGRIANGQLIPPSYDDSTRLMNRTKQEVK
jgi:hypothetical protein